MTHARRKFCDLHEANKSELAANGLEADVSGSNPDGRAIIFRGLRKNAGLFHLSVSKLCPAIWTILIKFFNSALVQGGQS